MSLVSDRILLELLRLFSFRFRHACLQWQHYDFATGVPPEGPRADHWCYAYTCLCGNRISLQRWGQLKDEVKF